MTMTAIKHHLTNDILFAYSAGTLPEAFSLMVASHLSLCDECRARVEAFDALGGAILDDAMPHGAMQGGAMQGGAMQDSALQFSATMSAGSLDDTFALIAGGPVQVAPAARKSGGVLPGPLQDYVGGDIDAIRWRSVGMGVKQAILDTSSEASARLLFIPAGSAMPDHGHNGTEMTMVLAGAFADEMDYFARGDVEIADEDLHHTPVADISEDCICLAVTDGPLKFKSILPKIAQPFLRI